MIGDRNNLNMAYQWHIPDNSTYGQVKACEKGLVAVLWRDNGTVLY